MTTRKEKTNSVKGRNPKTLIINAQTNPTLDKRDQKIAEWMERLNNAAERDTKEILEAVKEFNSQAEASSRIETLSMILCMFLNDSEGGGWKSKEERMFLSNTVFEVQSILKFVTKIQELSENIKEAEWFEDKFYTSGREAA